MNKEIIYRQTLEVISGWPGEYETIALPQILDFIKLVLGLVDRGINLESHLARLAEAITTEKAIHQSISENWKIGESTWDPIIEAIQKVWDFVIEIEELAANQTTGEVV